MADTFENFSSSLESPADNAASLTPNDSTDLSTVARGVYIGGAGDITVDFVGDGTNITITGLSAGVIYPFRVQRLYSTGTTATDIVGLW